MYSENTYFWSCLQVTANSDLELSRLNLSAIMMYFPHKHGIHLLVFDEHGGVFRTIFQAIL